MSAKEENRLSRRNICRITPRPARYTKNLRPPAAIAGFVGCFWSFSIPPQAQAFRHAIIPDGTVSLVFIRKQFPDLRLLRVAGPRATAWWLDVNSGDSFSGARLLPGAASPVLGISSRALRDRVQPLHDIAPELAARIWNRLAAAQSAQHAFSAMELEFARLAACAPRIDPAISQATTHIFQTNGNVSITRLATAARMSERQFRRRFSEAVGLTPKQFSRAVRVRYACIRMSLEGSAALAAIAHDAGYSDQPHLSREFARVFGSTAGGLSALIRSFEHGEFSRYRMSDLCKTESRAPAIQSL